MPENRQAFNRSMWVVSGGIMASRVAGLVRDVALAHVWGTGVAMAAFTTAFTMPNLLRAIFGEGNFSAAFVPAFSASMEKEGRETAWHKACTVVSSLGVVLTVVVVLTLPVCLVLKLFLHSELAQMTLVLVPLLMPYAMLVCVGGALGMVLNGLHHFAVPALTPILLNVFLVLAALVPLSWAQTQGSQTPLVLVPAVLAAGVLHIVFHLMALRRQGLRFQFRPDVRAPAVRNVVLMMAPAVLGTSVGQINIFVDRLLAMWLGADAVSALYYSQRLVYLPVGLFGVASSVVALPALSRAWARGDLEEMRGSLQHALAQTLFLALPIVGLLAVAGEPIVRLCFERGNFTAQSTQETLLALVFYLPGIPAFACVRIAASGFYASEDTRTPVRVALWCVASNLVFNLVLMQFLRQGGMALATTLSSFLNLGMLLVLFRRQTGVALFSALYGRGLRLLAALVVAIAAGVAARFAWEQNIPGDTLLHRVALVGVLSVVVYGSYAAAALILRCEEVRESWDALAGRIRRRLLALRARPGGPT